MDLITVVGTGAASRRGGSGYAEPRSGCNGSGNLTVNDEVATFHSADRPDISQFTKNAYAVRLLDAPHEGARAAIRQYYGTGLLR